MEKILFIAGIFAGSIITSLVMSIHYDRQRKRLSKNVTELQNLNVLVLWKMEEAGLIKWNLDSGGRIIGLNIKSKPGPEVTKAKLDGRTLH